MISCELFNFRNQFCSLNTIKSLQIRRLELAWGIVSLGNNGWRDFFQGFRPNIWRIFYLATEIWGHTQETNHGYLRTSDIYGGLVDADLQTATYRLGAALARCVARRTIDIYWLQHAKPLIDEGIITLTQGTNERPDYVGLDKLGGWHSIEAKGRSNPPGNIIADAKRQATRVQLINGSPPVTSCGCVSHLYRIPIHVEFCDPEPDEGEQKGIEITIDKEKYILKYYAPFIDLIYENADFASVNIETNLGRLRYLIPHSTKDGTALDKGIRYGIYTGLYDLISQERLSSYNASNVADFLEGVEPKDYRVSLEPDGSLLMSEGISLD